MTLGNEDLSDFVWISKILKMWTRCWSVTLLERYLLSSFSNKQKGIIFLVWKFSHFFAMPSYGGRCKGQKDGIIHREVGGWTHIHLFIIKKEKYFVVSTKKSFICVGSQKNGKFNYFLTLNSCCMSFPRFCPLHSLPLNKIDLNRISKDSK